MLRTNHQNPNDDKNTFENGLCLYFINYCFPVFILVFGCKWPYVADLLSCICSLGDTRSAGWAWKQARPLDLSAEISSAPPPRPHQGEGGNCNIAILLQYFSSPCIIRPLQSSAPFTSFKGVGYGSPCCNFWQFCYEFYFRWIFS